MSVLFKHPFDPIRELGQTLFLHMTSEFFPEPLDVACWVQHRDEVEGGRLYGLEFVDPIGLLSRLPSTLYALFNQRDVVRIEPDPEHPIEVTIDGIGIDFQVTGFLRDLSTDGLSFRTLPLAEVVLSKVKWVKVTFRLPDSSEELTFSVRIRHRGLIGDSICYGTWFDDERTEEIETKQEILKEYITDHRQEAIDSLVQIHEQLEA